MSDLTALLTSSGDKPVAYHAFMGTLYGNHTSGYSSSRDTYHLIIMKVSEDGEEVVYANNVSNLIFDSYGSTMSATDGGNNGSNYYVTDVYFGKGYKIYTDSAKIGETALSDTVLLIVASYDSDGFCLFDATDPTNVVAINSSPNPVASSSTYFNGAYPSYFVHRYPTTPNGTIHPFGPLVITREGLGQGGKVNAIDMKHLLPSGFIYDRNQLIDSTAYSGGAGPYPTSCYFIDNEIPVVPIHDYNGSNYSWLYPTLENSARSNYIDGLNADGKTVNSPISRVTFSGVTNGGRGIKYAYYDDTGYVDSVSGNASHLVFIQPATSNTLRWNAAPATSAGVPDLASHSSSAYRGTNPLITGADIANHTISNNTVFDVSSVGSNNVQVIKYHFFSFTKEFKASADSYGTLVAGFYYDGNHPSSGNGEEYGLVSFDIRDVSSNMYNNVSSSITQNTPVYDILDMRVVTEELYATTATGGGYTGTFGQGQIAFNGGGLDDIDSFSMDPISGIMCISAKSNVNSYSDFRSGYDYPTGYRYYKLNKDGTISAPFPQEQGGYIKQYIDNFTMEPVSLSATYYPRYHRGGVGYSRDVLFSSTVYD